MIDTDATAAQADEVTAPEQEPVADDAATSGDRNPNEGFVDKLVDGNLSVLDNDLALATLDETRDYTAREVRRIVEQDRRERKQALSDAVKSGLIRRLSRERRKHRRAIAEAITRAVEETVGRLGLETTDE